jgi:phytanoyl-CoA hydroxylase
MDLTALKQHYNQDGFVKIDRLLSAERLAAIDEELARYEKEVVPTLPKDDIVWEPPPADGGPRSIRNLWRLHHYSPFFKSLAEDPEFVTLASALCKGEAYASGVETFSKPARVGSRVPYHQDNAYFNLNPPDCFSLWIALDASTVENGCVYYAKGTHHEQLPHAASHVPGNSLGLAEAPTPGSLDEIPAELAPGDAICHHCNVIHRSEPNRSARSRRGLVIVYRAKHTEVDPKRWDEYMRILSELKAEMAKAAS